MTRKRLVAGNWKMNGTRAANSGLVAKIAAGVAAHGAEVAICPPAVYLESVGQALRGTAIRLGAQTLCEQDQPGAYTGEIHGAMLRELGCEYVLVGHSERRLIYGESDALVARKFSAAQACGLTPILCVGETLEEREAGATETVLQRQLDAVLAAGGIESLGKAVLAYEPVWAIGTGRTATPQQAQDVHAFLRGYLASLPSGQGARIAAALRLLYGGSVKADNAAALFSQPDVDGGLIGGASLKAEEFVAIVAGAGG